MRIWLCGFVLVLLSSVYCQGEDKKCAMDVLDSKPTSSCGCGATDRKQTENVVASPESTSNRKVVQIPSQLISLCKEVSPSTLLHIPGGRFTMGTVDVKNEFDGEGPPRQVQLGPFRLEQTEVSILQFCRFVLETNHVTDAEEFGWSFAFQKTLSEQVLQTVSQQVEAVPWWVPVTGANWLFPNGPSNVLVNVHLPATHVSHRDAKAYCAWLGRRLPTEAEFEFAMRGGLENHTYPWGNELTPKGKHLANLWQGTFPHVNLVEDGFEYACPVHEFGAQNPYGLFNIVGNVWEWVADAWITNHARVVQHNGPVLVNPQIEIQGRETDSTLERVKRGGSYMCHESYCLRYRTSSRSSNSADSSAQNLGFRCAADELEDDEDAKEL